MQPAGNAASSFEALHAVAAFGEHAGVDGVGDPAESVVFELERPSVGVERLAPEGRDDRDNTAGTDSGPGRHVNRAVPAAS
jgi:hypothetical protein